MPAHAPYTYGRDKALYGEVNSGGPEVAQVLHREALGLLVHLHTLTESNDPTLAVGAGGNRGPKR